MIFLFEWLVFLSLFFLKAIIYSYFRLFKVDTILDFLKLILFSKKVIKIIKSVMFMKINYFFNTYIFIESINFVIEYILTFTKSLKVLIQCPYNFVI